eukprot:12548299-Alexandrium_andersonii.AAC.1
MGTCATLPGRGGRHGHLCNCLRGPALATGACAAGGYVRLLGAAFATGTCAAGGWVRRTSGWLPRVAAS